VGGVERGGEVFRALADPTRRALLDSLFNRDGQTLNELCEMFPEMTRFGVMKHLAVLAEANLVITARDGRTKRHYLNPAPIEQIANRWISKYAARFTAALVALDDQVAADARRSARRSAQHNLEEGRTGMSLGAMTSVRIRRLQELSDTD
jgi:DNA-binding transcriptional ArsR family regulator